MTKRQWNELLGIVEDNKHFLAIKIHYEDTDFSGYVYHTGYLRFCERSRSDFLSLLNITQSHRLSDENNFNKNTFNIGQSGILFVVKSLKADFLKPAQMDDIIEVETRFIYKKGIRIGIKHNIYRGDERLFSADIEITSISENGKPTRLPKDISALIDYYIENSS